MQYFTPEAQELLSQQYDDQHKIEIMLNRRIVGKMPPDATKQDWQQFYTGFRREQLTPYELAASVYRGYAFAPVYKDRRIKDNFMSAWHVALDFDEIESQEQFGRLIEDPLIKTFAAFAYTSASHTAERQKWRIVFIFDTPYTDLQAYESLLLALLEYFSNNAKLPQPDAACRDGLRLYYGSHKCEFVFNACEEAQSMKSSKYQIWPTALHETFITNMSNIRADREMSKFAALTQRPVSGEEIRIDNNFANSRLNAIERSLGSVTKGGRHSALLRYSRVLGGYVGATWCEMTEQDAIIALLSACRVNGMLEEDGESECTRVIHQGLSHGKKDPLSKPVTRYVVVRNQKQVAEIQPKVRSIYRERMTRDYWSLK